METALAILFADVCDSTRLYEAAGNVRATEIIQGTLRRLEAAVAAQGGRVVKSLGDGLMCVFPAAAASCAAAEDMMAEVAARAVPGPTPIELRLRIGVHFGSVVDSGADVFGDAINVAARVESLASPGEILLTEEAVADLPAAAAAAERVQLVDTTTVKGKTIPIRIFKLRRDRDGEDISDSTVIGSDLLQRIRTATRTLQLTYLTQRIVVGTGRPKVIIGRHESCDIVILSRQASRQHGAIEFSRESFMLADHSSNGTFIRTGTLPPVALRRDSSRLVGSGLIGFGAVPESPDGDHVVHYHCDVTI